MEAYKSQVFCTGCTNYLYIINSYMVILHDKTIKNDRTRNIRYGQRLEAPPRFELGHRGFADLLCNRLCLLIFNAFSHLYNFSGTNFGTNFLIV